MGCGVRVTALGSPSGSRRVHRRYFRVLATLHAPLCADHRCKCCRLSGLGRLDLDINTSMIPTRVGQSPCKCAFHSPRRTHAPGARSSRRPRKYARECAVKTTMTSTPLEPCHSHGRVERRMSAFASDPCPRLSPYPKAARSPSHHLRRLPPPTRPLKSPRPCDPGLEHALTPSPPPASPSRPSPRAACSTLVRQPPGHADVIAVRKLTRGARNFTTTGTRQDDVRMVESACRV
ncbi:hypothetical protein C8Q79DRAFT_259445 [Trametes meyenii]|nr:hypothetical protein C8Q79DRAFT_259445 [Trametes meyenii]